MRREPALYTAVAELFATVSYDLRTTALRIAIRITIRIANTYSYVRTVRSDGV